jgi:hypothetical protein
VSALEVIVGGEKDERGREEKTRKKTPPKVKER